nr:FMN-binding protein [Propionibacterium sp.]
MSTRANIASTLASIGVLAIGWQVGTTTGQTAPAPTTATTTAMGTTAGTPTGTTTARRTTAAASAQSAATASGLTDGTFTGATATNRFGSVTVKVTVSGGKITNVTAATTAVDSKSAQINSRAVPVLKSEVLAAQSADIANVAHHS